MRRHNFRFYMHYRARHDVSIEARHAAFTEKMMKLPEPLGWQEIDVPPAPDCGDELGASFEVSYPTADLELDGRYVYRGESYHSDDESTYDDKVWITFVPKNLKISYPAMLREHLPRAMSAFEGYAGHGYFGGYVVKYEDLHADEIQSLQNKPGIDVNGRNNIFTLNVVQYWDAELCQRALGFGRDEVIRRLNGKVSLVKPLMDGVYIVFNDNPDLTFEEFCAVNDRFKPILGIV
ncbi:MAG: hypothetical protein IPK59_07360 [Rhodospirillaceae bacterium]|nr:hypothetical protein [Rhodospirillaceae bacterium]